MIDQSSGDHGLRWSRTIAAQGVRPSPEGEARRYATIEALGEDVATFTCDGDTSQDARKAIRPKAHIVVTNPDMLHKGILPHHTK